MDPDKNINKNELNHRKIKGNWFYFCIKRIFDILFSAIAIIILTLPMIVFGIIGKCSSKGPALIADQRIGKNGNLIRVLKFRSMYVDAETNIDYYLTPEQKEIWLRERKLDNDPRVTKYGHFIRKSSIDELPQLFNIFIGNMSFVGTRPITPRELEMNFSDEEKKILISGKPGLTGYWQIYGRGEIEYSSGQRQKLELEYFYKRSILFDLKLLILTIPAVFKGKGAK